MSTLSQLLPGERIDLDAVKRGLNPIGGWFKLTASTWDFIAKSLHDPWPPEVVGNDLAWWRDQMAMGKISRIPSHRVLAARWHWTEWQARRAMQQLGDPPAQEGTNRDERPARAAVSSRQQEDRMDLSGMSRFDDEDREREEAERSAPRENVQADPAVDLAAEVERRVAARLAEEEAEARIAEERRRLAMLGSVEVQATLNELEQRAGEPLTPDDVRKVRERIRQGTTGEEILLVDRWVRESSHSEAEYLRAGEYGPRTVLNDRFPKRLVRARAWEAGTEQPRQQEHARNTPPKRHMRQLSTLSGVLADQPAARPLLEADVLGVRLTEAPPAALAPPPTPAPVSPVPPPTPAPAPAPTRSWQDLMKPLSRAPVDQAPAPVPAATNNQPQRKW